MWATMEIRDPIHGNINVANPEVAVINSAAYQRLRTVKQLGLSEYSFPGATHNRFLHSLGVCHLSGLAFDHIFKGYPFKKADTRWRLRQTLRLAALLHDVGHGPLSHASEEVMPLLKDLHVSAYEQRKNGKGYDAKTKANHEDYTIKFLTDSPLTEIMQKNFPDLKPFHVACLIDSSLECDDGFFIEDGVDFRPLLCSLVSSELDVDRMDYLERDAYFCGINYGKVEIDWLLTNLAYYRQKDKLHLALNRRALYTFDDFLISRHHMHLMVYFHHKSIIYEEMLHRYLTSNDCDYHLPADINKYVLCNDYGLYQHMAEADNEWAKRITDKNPYRVLFEFHTTAKTSRVQKMKEELESSDIKVIVSNSKTRLSKYHYSFTGDSSSGIFVVDHYDRQAKPETIEKMTDLFQKYEETRGIERIYVPPEQFQKAEEILLDKKL